MIIIPANSASGGYEVANSCRFETDTYMNLSIASDGNARTWTYSFWTKRTKLGAWMNTHNFGGTGNRDYGAFDSSDRLELAHSNSGYQYRFLTNRVFRDTSAWYHIVIAMDTTQGTESNRTKIYINGVQETSFNTASYPSENHDTRGGQNIHMIGSDFDPSNYYFGYQAENVFVNGLQLGADSFGEFDEDSPTIWKPKDVSGLTFGTSGFYLDFEDSGTLGNDASGGSDFTSNNLAATDQATDTPTNNFATLNPLDNYYNASTFSEGNLQIATHASNEAYNTGTIGVTSGKWYWEVKISASQDREFIGISDRPAGASDFTAWTGANGSVAYYSNSGDYRKGSAGSNTSYGDSHGVNDIVGIALDVDNMKLYFSKNGTWQNSGDPTSGATGTGAISLNTPIVGDGFLYPAVGEIYTGSSTFQLNFGGCPAFTISSGNADGNGYGNFEYSVPSGYYSLCTKNLAEFG